MKRLSKLKYFCQICSKQCRDANGYKCHMPSETHKKQFALYVQNSNELIPQLSEQFQERFLIELEDGRASWLVANEVYSGIVRDPDHVHLKSTKWATLTDFLRDIESQGLVGLRPDPRKPSTFEILFIDKDQDESRLEEEIENRKRKTRSELIEQDKRLKIAASFSDSGFANPTAIANASERTQIKLSLPSMPLGSRTKVKDNDDHDQSETSERSDLKKEPEKHTHVVVDESVWIGCVVKIRIGEFSDHKGLVIGQNDHSSLSIQLIKSPQEKIIIKLDDIETVIPNINRTVRSVRGPSKGKEGMLLSVDIPLGVATVYFSSIDESQDFRFDDICKIH